MYDSVDSEYVCMDSALGFAFSAQSIVPMGCYSSHILLSEGTTIVNLTADPHTPSKEIGNSFIKSLQKSVASISLMNLWPTFNCAFATMVHGMEKLKMNLKCNESINSENGIRKSALVLVNVTLLIIYLPLNCLYEIYFGVKEIFNLSFSLGRRITWTLWNHVIKTPLWRTF